MKQLRVVGEDELCCSLGARIIETAMPGWKVHGAPINTGGVTKLLPSLSRFAEQARHVRPVLCIADTDGQCPVDMLAEHRPRNSPSSLFIRLAVPEAECWVLADRVAVSSYFQISAQAIPNDPERLADAKLELLTLARKSKIRRLRDEVVTASNPLKQGPGYNLHMSALIATAWSADRARSNSSSLQRTISRLSAFAAQQD